MSPGDDAATSFDAVGDLYDRYRPRYPESLISDLLALAGIGPESRLLEIGTGTGIATLPIARRGCAITCLEPGARLAAIARAKLAEFRRVQIVEEAFEDWSGEPEAFDLVFAAQAFHWLDPETRFQKIAATLKPRGSLAVFGNAPEADDSPIGRALGDLYARLAPAIELPSPMQWYAPGGPIPQLFADSPLFDAVQSRHYAWSTRYPTAAYQNLLRTLSDHNLLPEPQKSELLGAIAREIDRFGGEIAVVYRTHLYLARRST